MKFAVVVALLLCVYAVNANTPSETNYGNVHGRIIGSEGVTVESSMFKVKTYFLEFPKVGGVALNTFKNLVIFNS